MSLYTMVRIAICTLSVMLVFGCVTAPTPSDARLDLIFRKSTDQVYTEYVITEAGRQSRLNLSALYHPEIIVDLNATMVSVRRATFYL